ncbi:hypothetical protein [Cupriavidus necator]|uniref:hypothetical protein n=1 Tax=Cupriavidus necator TaxID=106590 RepID=UPI0005B4176D|nr:hypothetical protein [Cupriavidus necator]
MTFVRVALNGGGLLVEAHDGADAFAQVLVGEADSIADEEVRTLRGGDGGGEACGRCCAAVVGSASTVA